MGPRWSSLTTPRNWPITAVREISASPRRPCGHWFRRTRSTRPSPARRRRRPRALGGRAGGLAEKLGTVAMIIFAVLWYAAIGAVGLMIGDRVDSRDRRTDLVEFPAHHLRIVDQALVELGGELRYVAVVRRTRPSIGSPCRITQGSVLDRAGDPTPAGDRDRIETRPSLLPGDPAIVDVLHRRSTERPARANALRGRDQGPAGAGERGCRSAAAPEPGFDRDHCRVAVTTDASRPLRGAAIAILARGRDGEIRAGGTLAVRRLEAADPAGSSSTTANPTVPAGGRPPASTRTCCRRRSRVDEERQQTRRDPDYPTKCPSRAAEGSGPATPRQPTETSGLRHGANAGTDGGDGMATSNFAWVTHAPADYMLAFYDDPAGEHAVVGAQFGDEDQAREATNGLEAAEVQQAELRVYCTLQGEPELVLGHVREAGAVASWIDNSGRSRLRRGRRWLGDEQGSSGQPPRRQRDRFFARRGCTAPLSVQRSVPDLRRASRQDPRDAGRRGPSRHSTASCVRVDCLSLLRGRDGARRPSPSTSIQRGLAACLGSGIWFPAGDARRRAGDRETLMLPDLADSTLLPLSIKSG